MPERVLRLGIDPRPAERGAKDWERAVDRISRSSDRLDAQLEQSARSGVGIYQRAAQERIQLERRLATQRSSEAKVNAVAAAESFVRAQESYFQTNMARIRAAQARGLMSAKEASVAGQEAALAYNNAIVGVLDSPRYAGDRKAFTTLAGSIKNIDEAGKSAGVGMHRLNNSLIVLARQATGTHPVVGQLADVVGTFAIGTAKMVPILAGIAAIGGAWAVVTRDAREAKKQLEDNLEVLRRIQRERDIEARGGSTQIAVQAAQERAREIADALRAAQETGGLMLSGGGVSPTGPLLDELRELNRIIAAGLADIEETEAESRERRLEDERDFQRRMRELRGRVAMMADINPRTLGAFELQTGLRPPTATTPLQYGQSGLYDPGRVGVTSVTRPREKFEKWVDRTADNLKPLARGAKDAGDAFIDFGRLGEDFDLGNTLENAAGNLLSGGISTAAGVISDALFGPNYQTLLQENTRALRNMSSVLREAFFEDLPFSDSDFIQDLARRARFPADMDLTRRSLDASDATPAERFRALQQTLMRNVSGGLAPLIATLNQQNIDEFLETVIASMRAGTFDADALGNLSATQLLDVLAEMEGLADSTESVADEFDKLTKSIQALNSPSGLNLALLGYNAGLGGGGGGPGGSGGDTRRGGGGTGGGGGTRRGAAVVINVNGAGNPREVADEVMRRFERQGSRGGPSALRVMAR